MMKEVQLWAKVIYLSHVRIYTKILLCIFVIILKARRNGSYHDLGSWQIFACLAASIFAHITKHTNHKLLPCKQGVNKLI